MIVGIQKLRGGGLSPLARGNLQLRALEVPLEGPIPARAGEPGGLALFGALNAAYPRSRGGTPWLQSPKMSQQGLSPLARGNLSADTQKAWSGGPIPARAGEPVLQ